MYQSVSDRVIEYVLPLYGFIEHMYCDSNADVFVGIGHQLADKDEAKRVPFRWKDTNRRATAKEISAEWVAVKTMGIVNWRVDHPKQSQLYLHRIDAHKLAAHDAMRLDYLLNKRYPAFRRWPADAQMALILWLWTDGDLKPIDAGLRNETFAIATNALATDNKSYEIVKNLLRTAAKVVDSNAVRSKFWYPQNPPRSDKM